jgi:hypothetical protein
MIVPIRFSGINRKRVSPMGTNWATILLSYLKKPSLALFIVGLTLIIIGTLGLNVGYDDKGWSLHMEASSAYLRLSSLGAGLAAFLTATTLALRDEKRAKRREERAKQGESTAKRNEATAMTAAIHVKKDALIRENVAAVRTSIIIPANLETVRIPFKVLFDVEGELPQGYHIWLATTDSQGTKPRYWPQKAAEQIAGRWEINFDEIHSNRWIFGKSGAMRWLLLAVGTDSQIYFQFYLDLNHKYREAIGGWGLPLISLLSDSFKISAVSTLSLVEDQRPF